MKQSLFDNIFELPNSSLETKAKTLIGFEQKFDRIFNNFNMLLNTSEIKVWEKKYYPDGLPLLKHLKDRYPLVIFEGDVGTGKTAMAECLANRMTKILNKTGFFLRLSTRVRGEGLHGEMGNLVNNAFDQLRKEAGKKRLAFLLIDEADAIATTRSSQQMHQEEKAGVNTLIQKIDEIRELNGRAIVIMSTNRLHYLDEAIVRRAAVVLKFERPNNNERQELFEQDFKGIKLSKEKITNLVQLTGPENNEEGIGYSYSDFRLKLFPEIVAKAFPNEPISYELITKSIAQIKPSPVIK